MIDAYFSATKYKWILDHVPEARQKIGQGSLLAGTLDTWILWKMSGGKAHMTDASTASRTLLYNLETIIVITTGTKAIKIAYNKFISIIYAPLLHYNYTIIIV
jgi:glycerol kinase